MLRKYTLLFILLVPTAVLPTEADQVLFRNSVHAKTPLEQEMLESQLLKNYPNSKYAALIKYLKTDYSGPRAYHKQLTAIKEILRKWPDFPEAYLFKAVATLQTDSKSEVESDYNTFLRAKRNETYKEMMVGGIIYTQIEKFPEAIRKLNQAIIVNPKDYINPYYWRGIAHLGLRMRDRAVLDFTTCLNEKAVEDSIYHECFTKRGQARLEQRRFAEAFNDFSAALKTQPDNSDRLTDLAFALYGLTRYEEAEQYALSAIKADSRNDYPYFILAAISDLKGNCEAVTKYLDRKVRTIAITYTGHKFSCRI